MNKILSKLKNDSRYFPVNIWASPMKIKCFD